LLHHRQFAAVAGNTLTVSFAAGDATASGGASIMSGTLTNSVVIGNRITARSPHGSVITGNSPDQCVGYSAMSDSVK
jgi:hypothetical protein